MSGTHLLHVEYMSLQFFLSLATACWHGNSETNGQSTRTDAALHVFVAVRLHCTLRQKYTNVVVELR